MEKNVFFKSGAAAKKCFSALALVLLVSACAGCGDGGAARNTGGGDPVLEPLQAAFEGLLERDGDRYLSAFPPQMAADYEAGAVYRVFFGLDGMESWLELAMEANEESYGGGISVEYALLSKTDSDAGGLGEINLDYYTYKRYVSAENTESVCILELSYTIGGDAGSESKLARLYAVRQEGKWYLHPCHAFYMF